MLRDEYFNIFKNQDTHWWYRGMASINQKLLTKNLPRKKNIKILDAGCGPGSALLYLKKFGKVTGVDISDQALRYAEKRAPVIKGDIMNLPFKNESFDLVVCLDVLYHKWVKDEKKAISEFYRVLKKDGFLLLREPAYEWMRGNEDVVGYTRIRFSKKKVQKILKEHFNIIELTYVNFFLFPLVFLKRLPQIISIRDKQAISDIFELPKSLNNILFSFLKLESMLLSFMRFPFGSSVICLAKKYDKKR